MQVPFSALGALAVLMSKYSACKVIGVLKVTYLCPDTSAGTLAIAAGPAPHFVRAVQSALDRTSCHLDLCSHLH